jgi:uncharacterized surface protein with fasciclin (FAS1) repeats
MKTFAKAIAIASLAIATVATPAFAAPGAKPGTGTIVDIVVSDSRFDILQAAVIEADLAGALSSLDKQYTVFAPNDDAFIATFEALLEADLTESDVIGAIDAGGVDALLGDGALQNILLFHVTNGRRTSASVTAAPGYKMLNGDRLSRSTLVAAGLGQLNISASNGVIHEINSVLLP